MKIRQIDLLNRKDIKRFIEFPFRLYHNNPYWVPPLITEQWTFFRKDQFPFYEHSDCAFFIIESEGDILGRIAVLEHRPYNQHHNTHRAFFHLYESIDDKQVFNCLIDAAIKWLKDRSLTSLFGPKGFSRSNGVGILIKGFDHIPAMGIPYNYPYFPDLFENIGFKKVTDYYSGYFKATHRLPDKLYRISGKVKSQNNFQVVELYDRHEFLRLLPAIEMVHFEAFKNNPNFTPSSHREFKAMVISMIQISLPGMIKLIYKGNEIAGFIISYPNINRAIQKAKGKLFPFHWIRLLIEKRLSRSIDINGLGLLPSFQGFGANALLYTELEKTLRRRKTNFAELVQIDEQNYLSRSDMETLGVNWHKIHRTYSLTI